MSRLEDVLKPGNIIKIYSTIMGGREQWGIILSNNEVAYIDSIGGFDRLEEFNGVDCRIVEVYKPLSCCTLSRIKRGECMVCVYREIKHPREVEVGIEYEMLYGGITYTCCNVELFGKIYIVYKFLSSFVRGCTFNDIDENDIEYIKILEKEE